MTVTATRQGRDSSHCPCVRGRMRLQSHSQGWETLLQPHKGMRNGFNTPSKPKTRISTNPAGLADFLLHPLCCRLLQSFSIHPPFPLHTMCVSWDTARLPTPGGCSPTNTLPHTAPGRGAQHWQDTPSTHLMPGTALLLHCLVQGCWPPSPEWAGAGQEQSPGLGREQWVSFLQH